MPTTYHKKEEKMARTRNRIKKMNFQIQERRVEELTPLSDDDKYIIVSHSLSGKPLVEQDCVLSTLMTFLRSISRTPDLKWTCELQKQSVREKNVIG